MELIKMLLPLIDNEKFDHEIKGAKRLYKLKKVIEGQGLSDKDLSKRLPKDRERKEALKQLKLRLVTRLTDFIAKHGLNVPNVDEYARTYQKCVNQLAAIKVLYFGNHRREAAILSQHVLKRTQSWELTELTIILSRDLFRYYSEIEYSKRKMDHYSNLLNKSLYLYGLENKVGQMWSKLSLATAGHLGAIPDSLKKRAVEYSEEINIILREGNDSYQLVYSCYSVLALRYELHQDYNMLLKVCDEAQRRLMERPVSRLSAIFYFDLRRVVSLIHLGRNDEVEEIMARYFSTMTEGRMNWFVLKMYAIINRTHGNNYQSAYEIVHEIRKTKYGAAQPKEILEVWKVLEAYIEFLAAVQKIRLSESTSFRLAKFLNEVPIYTKDKRGLNISILIIQVLFLLQQRKYSQIIDRAESLKLYCNRYLRKDETFRSNCFIWMLLQMPRADFNRIRTERYAEPYLKKLQSVPLKISQQTIEVEVIPYEDLWAITLDLLN